MNKLIIIKFKKLLNIFIFLLLLTLLLIYSKQNFECVKESLSTFFSSVFPSLFPFILFTEITLKTNVLDYISRIVGNLISKIFKISKNSTAAVLIGFLCGFPMGAKTVISLYKKNIIDRNEALKLLTFTNNCNPVFILSTIGVGIFFDIKIGIILLISHYLSAIIIGILVSHNLMPYIIHENEIILNKFNKKCEENLKFSSSFEIIKVSIRDTFVALMMILGFIIIFNLIFNILNILLLYLNVNNSIISVVSGIFEMTKGIKDIYLDINLDYKLKICLASFITGFSGFCIIFQIFSCIHDEKFKLNNLIKSKLIHGIFSGIISYLLIKYTNLYTPASNSVFNQIYYQDIEFEIYMNNIKAAYLISTASLFLIIFIYYLLSKHMKKKQPKLLDHF